MLNAMEVREDDESFKNAVDLLFDALEQKDPDHFALRQYKKYKLAAGQTAVYPRSGATTPVSSMWAATGPPAGHQRPEPLCRCPYLRGVRYG